MIPLSVSTCSNPELTLEEALSAYGKLGFNKIEVFTSWTKSAVDIKERPQTYLNLARKYGFQFSSIHLPPFGDDSGESLEQVIQTCQFASDLGCRVVIVHAHSKENYIAGGKKLLDAVNDLPIIPVITNHAGTAISTLEDYQEVTKGINDPRMKYLLEIGHFHSEGVSWSEGYNLLAGGIELVHIKDQIGPQSVPFGKGEIDLSGLFAQLAKDKYDGDIVIEMEVTDGENTLDYLGNALNYINEVLAK